MRILLVNYEFPPVGGGGGVASLKLARRWAEDHEVDCLTSRVGELPRRQTVDGVRVLRVPVAGRRGLSVAPLLRLLSFPATGLVPGLELLRGRRYDVINTHFAVPSGPLGSALSVIGRLPNVVSVHGADVYDPTRRLSPHRFPPAGLAVRKVLQQAAVVVAQSRDIASRVATYYGADLARKTQIVPLPFDPPAAGWTRESRPEARAALGLEPDATYLVSVGRLVERKGYDRLVRSLALLPAEVRLVLMGDGPLRGALRELAERESPAGRVLLPGYVDERTKYRYLRAADLYVLSSHHEGFGIVLQEAMAAGLPIVATSTGGQTDLLTDDVNARLIASNAPEEIAAAVRELLSDEPLRRSMVRHNRRKVATYRSAAIGDRYVEIFRQAVRRCRSVACPERGKAT